MVAIAVTLGVMLAIVIVAVLFYVGLLVPSLRRRETVQAEATYAQARIDHMTEMALQQMRDAARMELRRQDGRQG